MYENIRKIFTLAAGILILCLLSLEQSTSAQTLQGPLGPRGNAKQSAPEVLGNRGCKNLKRLKGVTVQVFNPDTGISAGLVTNAGFLDGYLEDVVDFDSGVVFTPDPNVVAYVSDLSITTIHGRLAVRPVTAFNFVTGYWSEWGSIDPVGSTGDFEGATGAIFFSGKTIGSIDTGPYEAQIEGEICFSRFQ